jgi:aspartyl-tRNA(Asn)/glutamyl-tRNA(Gln) amidotransferase subunit A
MMNTTSIQHLAQQLRDGQTTPSRVLDDCLAMIGERNAVINAFVTIDAEGARAAAEQADARYASGQSLSSLDGVPIGIKDNIDVAGLPTSNGIVKGAAAVLDARVVGALRAAGAVIVGKLNMHEAALGATTDNPHFGRTFHPRFDGHTPGGSSGGSSAAVAAGMCWLSLGTDTMGSVRIPASYCGLFGFKPARGTLSNDGLAVLLDEFDCIGPLAATLDGITESMAVMTGDPSWRGLGTVREADRGVAAVGPGASQPGVNRTGASRTEASRTGPVRVAQLAAFAGIEQRADVRRVWRDVVALIAAEAGGATELAPVGSPVVDFGAARRGALALIEHAFARTISAGQHMAASDTLKGMLSYGERLDSKRLAKARVRVNEVVEAVTGALEDVDVLIAPVCGVPAFPFEVPAPDGQADFTAPANFAGLPSLSVPGCITPAGLPVGVQLIAKPGDEAMLFEVAAFTDRVLRAQIVPEIVAQQVRPQGVEWLLAKTDDGDHT